MGLSYDQSVIQAVAILIGLIFLSMALREWGVIKESDGGLFSRLITQFTLPALIFSALSISEFDIDKLVLALVMIVSQLICALLAWGAGNILKLSRPKRGALILASTFTSSGFLGYAVVKEVYADNPEALSDAAIVSELGVALLIFTLGVIIAIQYGVKETSLAEKKKVAIRFFYSPIFISLVAGILVSFLHPVKSDFFTGGIYKFLGTIAAANTLLVCLTIGSMLHFRDFRKVIPIVLLVIVIKLIIQPLLSYYQAGLFNLSEIEHQIVILEASMPTAALTAVFAKRYGCDAELTSILVFATFITSILTMIMILFLLG
jgi:predicted permease